MPGKPKVTSNKRVMKSTAMTPSTNGCTPRNNIYNDVTLIIESPVNQSTPESQQVAAPVDNPLEKIQGTIAAVLGKRGSKSKKQKDMLKMVQALTDAAEVLMEELKESTDDSDSDTGTSDDSDLSDSESENTDSDTSCSCSNCAESSSSESDSDSDHRCSCHH